MLVIMKKLISTLTGLLTLCMLYSCCGNSSDGRDSYCNPLDLDYGWGVFKLELPLCRTAADPCIVYFKDKYYLFSTHDVGGYRVSDDLLHWSDRHFNSEVSEAALNYGSYVAPAVAADSNYVYFIKLNRDRSQKTVKIIRSADPDKGDWEVCGEIKRVSDPSMFIDGGRYFITHGLGTRIRMFELDPETFEEIPGSERIIRDKIKSLDECEGGYEFGRREIYDEIEAPQWKGRFDRLPCEEGSWMVKHNGKYYLQYATPGTISIWYCDAVMTSDNIDGPFTLEKYNPVSLKAGGFIGGAGHSGVFSDRYGNWWEITTMWVGNSNEFERRLGLFPVSFDEQGRMQVHTVLGDYPMSVPQRKFDPRTESTLKGWWCLSQGKKCTASSYVGEAVPELAADENVRTWWEADGAEGEWLDMDLGGEKTVNALQLNFAELNYTPETFEDDYTAYRVYASKNGSKYRKIVDKSANTRTNPHEYIVLDKPVKASHIKVVCCKAMNGQHFAMRDLRVFGNAGGAAPSKVAVPTIARDTLDERFALMNWKAVPDATGYLVRFGVAPDFLSNCIQIKDGTKESLQLHMLTKGVKYYYRIDSYNESGLTEGEITTNQY